MNKKYLVLLIAFFVVYCGSNTDSTPKPVQVGYFKSDLKNSKQDNNRVFTFSIDESFTENQIRNHAGRLMNTTGRNTWGYYYLGKTPDPTLAKDADNALDIAEQESFVYSYMKFADGSVVFRKHD